MIERLPERVRTPAVARAVVSPSALILAGAGTAVAIVGGLPVLAAAGVGALCWAARIALAVPRRGGEERIDPWRVGEPWRSFVRDAQAAQRHFETTCARTPPGPLRDHLVTLGRRLGEGVTECWRVARQGDALERAWDQLDVAGIKRELSDVRDQARGDTKERAVKALQSQLDSAARIQRVALDARDRLRVLNAQLDEAVARAVELSVNASDLSGLSPLAEDVDSLVGELESLRQGLVEASGQPGTPGASGAPGSAATS